ncbi:ATP-dependent helicase [Escherichia coli]|uniref:ATP-dependent helicase n=1 Tax=Escherichia coli TaxID=562 RepID=A0AAX2KB49_ECOLX|nr:ATP-dependent helicase [Escherichia coli]
MNYWQPVRLSGRGKKKLGEDDGLVALHLQEYAAESFTPAEADQANRSALQQAIVAVLADGGAWFAQQISQRIRDKIGESVDLSALQEALWALVWQGVITSDIWGTVYAPSPAAVPTHAPQLAAVTRLVVDVLSMRNPSRRWYLTTHQIWLDAGRYCRWSH